ncbi:hypothetical protein BDF19DRAFT_416812 [Syncephalis fuscata]|nr:hypothetical protein BDF19DRAFT_416812 [Syncephalis fuscata]
MLSRLRILSSPASAAFMQQALRLPRATGLATRTSWPRSTNALAAAFSTTPRHQTGWLSASITPYQSSVTTASELSPDYEIRRHHNGNHPLTSSTQSSAIATDAANDATNDWMDVLDDAAEAQEAIRAFKEDGLVLGLSNRDGQFNLMNFEASTSAVITME